MALWLHFQGETGNCHLFEVSACKIVTGFHMIIRSGKFVERQMSRTNALLYIYSRLLSALVYLLESVSYMCVCPVCMGTMILCINELITHGEVPL